MQFLPTNMRGKKARIRIWAGGSRRSQPYFLVSTRIKNSFPNRDNNYFVNFKTAHKNLIVNKKKGEKKLYCVSKDRVWSLVERGLGILCSRLLAHLFSQGYTSRGGGCRGGIRRISRSFISGIYQISEAGYPEFCVPGFLLNFLAKDTPAAVVAGIREGLTGYPTVLYQISTEYPWPDI